MNRENIVKNTLKNVKKYKINKFKKQINNQNIVIKPQQWFCLKDYVAAQPIKIINFKLEIYYTPKSYEVYQKLTNR